MILSTGLSEQLCQLLNDHQTGWSLGTFGAIAEFNRRHDEEILINHKQGGVHAVTSLGALHIEPHPDARLLPYESLSTIENAWSQGIVICLAEADAAMAGNSVLTDLGVDQDGLRTDEGARFFDLGLGVRHVDFCIRTSDAALIGILEGNIGRNLLAGDTTVMQAVQEISPVRVFRSRLSRIEIYQAIPSNQSSAVTPGGPHTHLIGELLAHGRTHAANVPVLKGWLPCLAAWPPNPIRTTDGSVRAFDMQAFERFQNFYQQHADPALAALKRQTFEAIEAGVRPESIKEPDTRAGRTAVRVALRQCHHIHGPSANLSRWKAVYEPTGRQ
jgi:hypothetical protein